MARTVTREKCKPTDLSNLAALAESFKIKERDMRIAITIVTLLALLAAAGLANSEADKESTLSTAYNIWRASKMKCINFKQGVDIIPAGTEVRDVKIKQQEPFPPYLVFTTVGDGRTSKLVLPKDGIRKNRSKTTGK
jgi:hypothetical protein